MVLVENTSIILEDDKYVIYIHTANGVCTKKIDSVWAVLLQQIINQNKNMTKQLLDTSITQCELLWREDAFVASLESHKEYQGPWEEALCTALRLEIPIYIDSKVLVNDYCPSESHELFVQELLDKEQKYWETANAMHLAQKISQDIREKRVGIFKMEEFNIKSENTKQIGK